MKRKLLSFIISVVVVVLLSACSNNSTPIDETISQNVDESIDWIISPEEITVEVGEKFQIEYSPSQEERPLFSYQKENGERETYDTRILGLALDLSNWDPNKPLIQENDKPGFETFEALSVGTTYIFVNCGNSGTTNRCKVNVIEKNLEENGLETLSAQGVNVVLANTFPQVINSYGARGERYASCVIQQASVNIFENEITVSLLCEKTFDFKGGTSTNCPILWKLYNGSGVVVDSGMVLKHNIDVNEKFYEEITIRKSFAPGSYTLSFTDYK